MRRIRVIVWFVTAVMACHALERCSSSNRTNSLISINCARLGLDRFPFGTGFTEFIELSSSEESDYDMEIDLSRNEIRQAQFSSSGVFRSLSRIDLSYNKIASLKNVVISTADSVKTLDLSHNEMLDKVSRELESKTLEVLKVSGCSIVELEEGILEGLPYLTSLDVSNNSLTELSRFAPDRPVILDATDESEPKHFRLKHLNLSHNSIQKVHGKYFGDTKVKVLDLSYNAIAQFKFTMYLHHLEELYVSSNNLRSLDGMALPNVRVLDVSRNRLSDMFMDFTVRAPKLKTLNMAYNSFEKLSQIKSLSLTELDLSYCNINRIEPDAFQSMENLRKLNLMGNELTVLSAELFKRKNLEYLFLGENPWECNCKSREFKDLYNLVLFERRYYTGRDVYCNGETNIPWEEACKDNDGNGDLYWSKRTTFYAMLYIFGTLFGIFLILMCYKCIRNLRQSDTMTFSNREIIAEDESEVILPQSEVSAARSEAEALPHEIPRLPDRRSTPPPNYEAALSLPVLTEEQRELALSTVSLHRIN